ncbi:MAG: HD domain-containing phosphohydrolase [Pseudomonadota bacterium]
MTRASNSILVVDDEKVNLLILDATLSPYYTVHTARDGIEALAWLAAGGQADLILSDVVMPNLDGYALCRQLKSEELTRDIPLLFLTSLDSSADEEHGLSLGAEDFIHKPISPPVVLARIRNHLELAHARARLRERNAELELLVLDRTHELLEQKQQLINSQGAVITAFCSLAEARDNETGNHILRTQRYVEALARHLQHHPRFAPMLDEEAIRMIFKSAPLHDVGKVGIPDAILLKPGPLTETEWRIMRRHTEFGRDAILRAEQNLGEAGGFLRYACDISYCHHEKWDGSGYPQGLAEEQIPLSARLMAVADVYDALISRRPYKPPFTHERAMAIIAEGKGNHFDPDIAVAFVEISDQFADIAASYRDDKE